MSNFKGLFRESLDVVREFIWRSFGLFLFVLGAGAGVGGFLGDVWVGIFAVFGGALLVAVGWIGYRIVTTGKADKEDVAIGMRKAAEQVQENKKESKNG